MQHFTWNYLQINSCFEILSVYKKNTLFHFFSILSHEKSGSANEFPFRNFLLKIANIYTTVSSNSIPTGFLSLNCGNGIDHFRQTGLGVQFGHRSEANWLYDGIKKIKYEYIRLNISGSVTILTKNNQNNILF